MKVKGLNIESLPVEIKNVLVQSISCSILVYDDSGIMLYVNDFFCKTTGYRLEDAIGNNVSILRSGVHTTSFYSSIYDTIERTGIFSSIVQSRRKNGTIYAQSIVVTSVEVDGRRYYVSTGTDVANSAPEIGLLLHDPLTGLPDRQTLSQTLQNFVGISQVTSQNLGVFKIYVTFRPLLDVEMRNLLICDISTQLRSLKRKTDFLCRLNDTEFVLLTLSPSNVLEKIACDIIDVISNSSYSGETLYCNIGISNYPDDNADINTVFVNARSALNAAKNCSCNTFRFWENSFQHTNDLLLAENVLRKCLTDPTSFEILFQPQYNLSTNEICGVEALLRVEGALLSTYDIIRIAEDSHLIIPLGEQILERCISTIVSWPIKIPISVNVSTLQLRHSAFDVTLLSLLEKYNVHRDLINIEFTETQAFLDDPNIKNCIKSMVDAGTCLILDDFGTGFANIANISTMKVSKIKLDKSFIDYIGTEHENIVEAVIAMAISLKLKVIAEGVSSHKQYHWLLERDCHAIQGYFFSQPVTSAEFQTLVKHSKREIV